MPESVEVSVEEYLTARLEEVTRQLADATEENTRLRIMLRRASTPAPTPEEN